MLKKVAHLIKGKDAESAAASFLKKHGLNVIDSNKRYKTGEIDIIAKDDACIVFVEVKYRGDDSHGNAAEMVDTPKQQKLQKTALLWIQENDPKMLKPCRFDVIAISGKQYKNIEWIKNAF